MADDANRVVVSIEAQTQQLEQGARRADQVFDRAMTDIERSASSAERQIVSSSSNSARSLERIRTSSGATRAGMQQLSFQLSDVAQGFALGVSPMTIFAQQSGQVVQALQLMSGESKGLIGFLGGPWGIALSAAASVAVALGSALFDGADAADKMADHQSDLADYVDMTTGKIKDQVAAISLLVEAQRRSKTFGEQVQEYQHNRNALAGAASNAGNGEFSGNLFAPGNFAKPALTAAQQQIKTLGEQYRRGEINANALGVAVHKIGLEDPSVRKITDGIERLADATVRSAQSAVKTQASIAVLSGTASDAQKKMLGIATATDSAAQAHTHAASAARDHASATNEVAQQIDLVGEAAKGASDAVDRLMKELPGSSEKFTKAQAEAFRRIFGDTDELGQIAEAAANAHKARQQAERQGEAEMQRVREQHIRTAANIYFDLFSGGTHRIWQDFERLGLQIISKLLAEWTINSFAPTPQGGTGGGLGGLIGSIAGALGIGGGSLSSASPGGFNIGSIATDIPFAFANGGSGIIGGQGGVDQNVLSLNGSPVARVGRGELLSVTPGAAKSGAASPIAITLHVEANDYFDARVADISGPIAARTSVQVVREAAPHIARQGAQAAPAVVRRKQKLG